MILGTDGEKMSKSRGNVINPDDVVNEFGAVRLNPPVLHLSYLITPDQIQSDLEQRGTSTV